MKMYRAVHGLVALGFLLSACGSGDQAAATYSAKGVVADSGAGTTVEARGAVTRSTTTDASGAFAIGELPAGDYSIVALPQGSVTDPGEIKVSISNADISGLSFKIVTADETLSSDVLKQIDAEPEAVRPDSEVILPNGEPLDQYLKERNIQLPPLPTGEEQTDPAPKASGTGKPHASATGTTGPEQLKNDIVATMLASARDMSCGRDSPPCTKYDYEADPANPALFPAQHGLAYVYGGRTPGVRTKPKDSCPQQIYGVDCSGLIIVAAGAAGLTAPATSALQSVASNWNIPAEYQLQFKEVPVGSYQSGDIVAWPGHIGIADVGGQGSSAIVTSATGQPNSCAGNLEGRGPRKLTIAQLHLGTPTKVLRLVTTLSGAFDMHIKCDSQSTDASVIRFNIDNDNGGPFQAKGSGVDYNGAALCFNLSGSYDQASNTVSGLLALCDNTRSDSFSETLLKDDTGYFPMTKVIDNGQCLADARLVRVQDTSTPQEVPRHAPVSGSMPAWSRFGSQ